MKLSVIVPSIRPEGLEKLYSSIDIEDFEMIAVGPYFDDYWGENSIYELKSTFIKSFRSPNACQQQGLMVATGDYITFASDDGIFLPGALDEAFNCLFRFNQQRTFRRFSLTGKEIVVGKYLEGDNPNPDMLKDDYYKFKYHKAYRLPGVPQENLIFNCGIISREFMLELGGWDAQNFECTTCAHADLGIRACSAGGEMILMDEPMFQCSHQPGRTGDHGPVHEAMKRDLKTFKSMYSQPRQIKIDINNWKLTEEKWSRRFRS